MSLREIERRLMSIEWGRCVGRKEWGCVAERDRERRLKSIEWVCVAASAVKNGCVSLRERERSVGRKEGWLREKERKASAVKEGWLRQREKIEGEWLVNRLNSANIEWVAESIRICIVNICF